MPYKVIKKKKLLPTKNGYLGLRRWKDQGEKVPSRPPPEGHSTFWNPEKVCYQSNSRESIAIFSENPMINSSYKAICNINQKAENAVNL